MTDAQPANTFERIQSLCRDYRRQLKRAAPVRIEDYLHRVEDTAREMLFQNLLQIDIEFQRTQHQSPASADYIARFPNWSNIVRNAFFESTLMSQSPLVETPALERTHRFGVPAARKLGEYELLRELGRGSFGMVYEARHLHRLDVVALKTLPASIDGHRDVPQDADSLHRFKREFRTLADISHANLVGLHSLECDGGQWFFTMDLISGTDFQDYVRPQGILNEDRLRSAMTQLVTGVLALHANYVIHRDLKPSNVMVDRQERVVLLDFGLALEQHHNAIAETANGIAGTPAYMAPEQAMGDTVTTACDWYAVGVMLYEALAGQLPFAGSALKVLQDKQHQPAPPFPHSDALPEDLRDLCLALLQTDPTARPDPAQISRVVAAADGSTQPLTGGESNTLVGRETQLNALRSIRQSFMTGGNPVAVFVDGRSGEGKTSLCSAFLDEVRQQSGCAVVSGRCYDRESVPFKALDAAIDAVCGYLKGLPPETIHSVLPSDVQVLRHTFPAFGRVREIRDARSTDLTAIDEKEIRNRAFQALREVLKRIADRQPVILFVDDLQWGDTDSAEALLRILCGTNAPRIFFLGTYRTDEADDSRFLSSWHTMAEQQQIHFDMHSLSVGPLTIDECRHLMVESLHLDPETIRRRADKFFGQTGGNAFLLTELINCFDPDDDSFRQVPVHQMIQDKLRQLPEESVALLQLVCVSGQALSTQEVAAAANCGAVPMAILTRMKSARLIRFLGESGTPVVDTYHDRIRETVMAELDAGQTQILHRWLAEAIERLNGGLTEQQLLAVEQGNFDLDEVATPRLFDLAFHFSTGESPRKACAYAILAAEQARRQSSLESAAAQYQTARSCFEHLSRTAQYQLLLKLGDTLRLLGRYDDAETALTEAHQLATDELERGEVELIQADAIREAGRYQESAERFAQALQSLGVTVPKTLCSRLIGIAGQALVQVPHTLLRYPRPTSTPANPRQTLIIRLLNGYVMSLWFRSTPAVVWTTLTVLNRAERSAISRELCISWSLHGFMCMLAGLDDRGHRYFRRSAAATSVDDFTTQTKSRLYAAAAHYSRARFPAAREHSQLGLEVVQRSGESWLGLLLKLHRLLSEFRLGNLETALREALDAFSESVRSGDPNTAQDYMNFIAMMTDGRFRFEDMRAAVTPIPDNIQATNQKLQAEARWHLGHERFRQAHEKAEEGWQLMKSHIVINHITNPNFPLLLEATRRYAADLQREAPSAAQSLLKQGYRRAKWAALVTRGTADHPAVLRELGRFYRIRGSLRKSIRITEQSCRVAEACGMKQELALSRLAVTQYCHEAGTASADECAAAETTAATFQNKVAHLFEEHPFLK